MTRGKALVAAMSAALVLAAVAPVAALPPPGRLFTRTAVSPTTNPKTTVLADMNGDGRADLVSAVGQTGDAYSFTWGVAVMTGRSDGGFDPAVLFGTAGQPQRLQVLDATGDGYRDVAVVQRVDDEVSSGTLLRGNVRGELLGGPDLPLPPFSDMAFGRFWESPGAQIAVASAQGLAIYRPVGSAGYTRDRIIAPAGASRLLAADLDGDGVDELVAAAPNGALTLYRDLVPVATEKIAAIAGLAAADATGDGHPEVLATGTNGEVLVLDAAFARVRRVNPTQYASSATVGDLDGDGLTDVVRANEAPSLSVFFGKGGAEKVVPLSAPAAATIVADGDGDGIADLIAAETASSLIEVIEGDGAGNFAPQRTKARTGTGLWETKFGDVNNDGRQDVLAGRWNPYPLETNTYQGYVFVATPTGGYTQSATIDQTGNPTGNGLVDVNGDGNLDVVATGYYDSSVSTYFGNGDGTFGPRVPSPSCVWNEAITTGDFNGDGFGDAATICRSTIYQDHISVMLGTPAGLVRGPSTSLSNTNQGWALETGDLNGDDVLDLVIGAIDHYRLNLDCLTDLTCLRQRDDRPVTYFLGLGNALFTPTSQDFAAGEPTNDFAVADVTGDGRDDILATLTFSDRVRISPGKADGTLGAPIFVNTYDYPRFVSGGDLDGDGKAELVVSHYSYMVSVAKGNGDGTFGAPVGYASQFPVADMPILDMNGDGKRDIAAIEYDGVEVFLQA